VKILDFGLVKNVSDTKTEDLTQTGLFMGSPKYMAPEQIRGDRVDARTDIYALGIIMYEMIAGKVPFDRPNSVNILMAQVNEEAPPLRVMNPNTQVSLAFEELIARCMSKSPDQRFSSMDEVLAALKRLGAGGLGQTFNGLATGEFRALGISGTAPRLSSSTPDPAAGGTAVTASFVGDDRVLTGSGSMLAPAIPGDLVTGPMVSSPPPGNGSKSGLATALLGVPARVGIVGYAAFRPGATAVGGSSAAAAPSALVAPPSAAAPTAPSPPPVAIVKVRINTDPDGATVKEDGVELCGSTPCDIL